jgi:Amt family ammonium transporter
LVKPTVLGAATGAVAGLVAITPGCAFVSPVGSILVGIGAGLFCYAAVTLLKPALGYDDSLDVFGVHGVGGAWGALATGLFVWSAGAAGPDVSWTAQVPKQLVSILFTAVFCPVLTIAILLVLRALFGSLRVTEENEHLGLDITEHSEGGYSLEIS